MIMQPGLMARFERNEQAKQEIADLLTDLLFTLFMMQHRYYHFASFLYHVFAGSNKYY